MAHQHLSCEHIVVNHGDHQVLNDVSIDISPGKRTAILGANGSGKTTLMRALSGAIKPKSGHVLVDGVPLKYNSKGLNAHRSVVQLVLQNPDDQLFSADVYRDVSFGPVNQGLSEEDARARVEEALALMGVTHLAERPTHQLSYGERKRVACAGAVAMRPCILMLDEPTAGMDPDAVSEMLAALERLEAANTTVAMSTHDLDMILTWADRAIIVLDKQTIVGDPVDLLSDEELINRTRLQIPWPLKLAKRLADAGKVDPSWRPRSLDDVSALLCK
ncbi:energy-coupling factor ABC transporter ATP-binding protein [Stomatohabitans albus]|uniref:energy-coupling factor ABC transporter ATP-binding protein n=1 Tax=Stomatohabitans albus TaxID=3110766 RepID=UPI00300C45EA